MALLCLKYKVQTHITAHKTHGLALLTLQPPLAMWSILFILGPSDL